MRILGRSLRNVAAALLLWNVLDLMTVMSDLWPATRLRMASVCRLCVIVSVVANWLDVRVMTPVSTGLQQDDILSFDLMLELSCRFVGILKCLRALAPGRHLRVGLLVQR